MMPPTGYLLKAAFVISPVISGFFLYSITKTAPKRKSFQDCLLVYSNVLLSVLYRTEVISYQYLAAHTGES